MIRMFIKIRIQLFFCVILFNPITVFAAPDFNTDPTSIVWNSEKSDIQVAMQLRRDAASVDIRVINIEGGTLHNEQLFNLRAGTTVWRWSGKVDNADTIEPGLYRIVFQLRFIDGITEQEVVQLRITKPQQDTNGRGDAFAPPVIKPVEPSYQLNGDFSFLRRFDSERDDVISETRLNVRYADKGKDYNLRTNIGYFRRSNGIENGDSSYALYQRFWNKGSADLVYRQSLGSFNDPLRLFSDFRSQNDKLGARIQQQFSVGQLTLLGYEGQGLGEETGSALRWQGNLTDTLKYGVGVTYRNNDSAQNQSTSNNVSGFDLDWQPSKKHRVAAQYVITSTDDDNTVSTAIDGNGQGSRITWHYTGETGLRASLGYLNLSSNYNAVLSDPGDQIRTNAEGPELTLNYFKPQTDTDWLKDIAVGLRAFSYSRDNNESDTKQVDVITQVSVKDVRLSGNYRRRDESDNVTTTLLLSEQHKWTKDWRGGVQYSRIKTSGTSTQRMLVSGSTGTSSRSHRLGLEIGRRTGTSLADGAVDEVGLLANGRLNQFVYEGLVRQTINNNDDDVNVFALFGYEKLYLHRYRALAYVSFGDRSATQIAGRIEFGIGVSF